MMKVFFSVLLLFSICEIEARSRLEDVIKNYESKYGLIFDMPNILSRRQQQTAAKKETPKSVDLSKRILQLGMDVSGFTDGGYNEKVKIVAPLSIASVLGQLLLAANGKTYSEIFESLGFNKNDEFYRNPYMVHSEFGRLLGELNKSDFNSRSLRRRNTANLLTTPKITIANGIFVNDGITLRPDYQSTIERIYKSEISNLNFRQASGRQARDYINTWIEKKTHGKIPRIISEEIPHDRNVIIVNALYFRSMWENPFIRAATSNGKFYPDGVDGRTVTTVPMMTVTGIFPTYESKEHDCRIIGMPYKGSDTIMYIILPNISSRKKLLDLQARLDADTIEEWIRRAQMKSMLVSFPKMHLKSSVNLKEPLEAKGLKSVFDSKQCDLSLMVAEPSGPLAKDNQDDYIYHIDPRADTGDRAPGRFAAARKTRRGRRAAAAKSINASGKGDEGATSQGIFVEDIFHKVDLNINEEGTEGAAITATVFGRADFEDEFDVNVPFMLLVRHTKTKLAIFYGSVFDPSR